MDCGLESGRRKASKHNEPVARLMLTFTIAETVREAKVSSPCIWSISPHKKKSGTVTLALVWGLTETRPHKSQRAEKTIKCGGGCTDRKHDSILNMIESPPCI